MMTLKRRKDQGELDADGGPDFAGAIHAGGFQDVPGNGLQVR
jgi:hypothetical protein